MTSASTRLVRAALTTSRSDSACIATKQPSPAASRRGLSPGATTVQIVTITAGVLPAPHQPPGKPPGGPPRGLGGAFGARPPLAHCGEPNPPPAGALFPPAPPSSHPPPSPPPPPFP